MLYLIKILIFGHACKWEVIECNNLNLTGPHGNVIERGEQRILQCEKCGNIKTHDTV